MKIARNLMHRNVFSIEVEKSMLDAYILMEEKNIRHLPVISSDGSLVGILSDRDVKKAMAVKKINEFEHEITLPANAKVSNFMSWPVMTINENTSLKKVAEIMIEQKISALVIEDGHGGPGGIVTTEDLLKFMVERMKHEDHSYQWPQLALQYYLNR
jgi:acetoin utilization protein AcuB